MHNKIIVFIFVLLLLVALIITILNEMCILAFSTPITIWTILLVLVTFYYAHISFQILENQNNSEKVKWFQQIHLEVIPNFIVADQLLIKGFNLHFDNISEGIAIDNKIQIFEGDSLLEFEESDKNTVKLNIGAIPSKIRIEKSFILVKDIKLKRDEIRKFRIFLEFTNPLKIKNGLYYTLECFAETNEKIRCSINLVDFNNGISAPDFKKFRSLVKE